MVYNKIDQLVLTQDSLQRNAGQWLFTKYDALGRTTVTGLYADGSSRSALQTAVDQESANSHPLWEQRSSGGIGYTDDAFPRTIAYYHGINYYDDYDFPGGTIYPFAGKSAMTRGLPTGSMTTVLGSGNMLMSVIYYDGKGRVLKTFSQHYLDGTINTANYDEITNEWNFDSSLKSTARVHHVGTASTTIANAYTYDHMGRKLTATESINGANPPTVISSLAYNEIGQLKDKTVGNNLNTTSYTYNERGWLKTVSSPVFSEELRYNDAINVVPQYNGNIANQYWGNTANPVAHHYDYSYDKLNRLLRGTSDEGKDEILGYDIMGNIGSLNRDNLGASTYSYINGNRLGTVTGPSVSTLTSYLYDGNGNAKTDGMKNFAFSYNYLNLVSSFGNGSQTVANTWTADGRKIRKAGPGGTRDYISGIEYNNSDIDFVQTEEGRAVYAGGGYSYEYMVKDHLGNTRVLLKQDGSVLEQTDYYPFGMQITRAGQTVPSPPNGYKYNGKELQTDLDLGQYDYGARFYDPVIGRFNVIDRFAEKYYGLTNYQYAANNPIKNIDLNGDSIRVSSSITDNKLLNNSFNDFASTKAGRRFLSKYAAAGQTIGGHTFKENGKFSSKGIDINYSAANLSDGTRGETSTSIDNGRGQIDISINSNNVTGSSSFNRESFSKTTTLFHESFIHGDLFTRDYLDDKLFNYSNISAEAKRDAVYPSHYQHFQVLYDYRDRGYNNGNLWPLEGFNGLKELNSSRKIFTTDGRIIQSMWNYSGGVKLDEYGQQVKK